MGFKLRKPSPSPCLRLCLRLNMKYPNHVVYDVVWEKNPVIHSSPLFILETFSGKFISRCMKDILNIKSRYYNSLSLLIHGYYSKTVVLNWSALTINDCPPSKAHESLIGYEVYTIFSLIGILRFLLSHKTHVCSV